MSITGYRGVTWIMVWVYMLWAHFLVLNGMGYHMLWTTVVHTIYNLLSTTYAWCGDILWVHISCSDEGTRTIGTEETRTNKGTRQIGTETNGMNGTKECEREERENAITSGPKNMSDRNGKV